MMRVGTRYIGVATDHVIESFRNRMWPEYKTGQGVEPQLLAQFPLLEETLRALGVIVWAMEEYEADDALASAAFLAQEEIRVKRVVISTPDKDLAQCVLGTRVVQLDRRRRLERDEQGVIQKFGVKPSSIPDYLALMGDAARRISGTARLHFAESTKPPTSVRRQPVDSESAFFETIRSFSLFRLLPRSAYDEAG
jgi:5'-3' exonuclease